MMIKTATFVSAAVAAGLGLVVGSQSVGLVSGDHTSRNAHFTMEFIPTFKNGLPHKCSEPEIAKMETFLGQLLAKETGLEEHDVEYIEKMYEPQPHHSHMQRHQHAKIRGFDFTFDCPGVAMDHAEDAIEACEASDWCRVLCRDENVRPGHESLTEMANTLKQKLHTSSKSLEVNPIYGVKCLGHTEQLDFHLMVSVSPPENTRAGGSSEEL
mmetsp:Transcript_45649/g.111171  ORF Transcript_45649/g.111171 Transcript_45649/m.111171 type:complete len:212 (+) Transcript_45649:272-907(+)